MDNTHLRFERLSQVHTETNVWGEMIFTRQSSKRTRLVVMPAMIMITPPALRNQLWMSLKSELWTLTYLGGEGGGAAQ